MDPCKKWGRTFLVCEWQNPGAGCPERWSSLEILKTCLTSKHATRCRKLLYQGVGLDDLLRSLPAPVILWFWNSMQQIRYFFFWNWTLKIHIYFLLSKEINLLSSGQINYLWILKDIFDYFAWFLIEMEEAMNCFT